MNSVTANNLRRRCQDKPSVTKTKAKCRYVCAPPLVIPKEQGVQHMSCIKQVPDINVVMTR